MAVGHLPGGRKSWKDTACVKGPDYFPFCKQSPDYSPQPSSHGSWFLPTLGTQCLSSVFSPKIKNNNSGNNGITNGIISTIINNGIISINSGIYAKWQVATCFTPVITFKSLEPFALGELRMGEIEYVVEDLLSRGRADAQMGAGLTPMLLSHTTLLSIQQSPCSQWLRLLLQHSLTHFFSTLVSSYILGD